MFHSTKLACPPDAVISASVGSSPSRRPSLGERRRSPQTTAAPSAARRLAIARPRPLEAPETIATSPSRRPHPRMPGSGVDIDVQLAERRDRKSTRLNSSHVEISYAVFCLKKKKKKTGNSTSDKKEKKKKTK